MNDNLNYLSTFKSKIKSEKRTIKSAKKGLYKVLPSLV